MPLARPLLAALAAAAALGLGACGSDAGDGGNADGVTVVATTTQAADLVANVARGRARTVGLLPPNADPHDYDLRPGDVKALADAQLVVRSGGDLDEWLDDADRRGVLLRAISRVEAEPSLLGASAHLLAVARRRV